MGECIEDGGNEHIKVSHLAYINPKLLGVIMESFLPVELPPCPVCGGEVFIAENDGKLFVFQCSRDGDHIWEEPFKTEQSAIEAYLATPYCKMYLKMKENE